MSRTKLKQLDQSLATDGQIMRWDDATSSWIPVASGSGGGGGTSFTFTALQTSNYTASSGDRVKFNPDGGTFTLTAPASPSADDLWAVKNVSTSSNAVQINGNGDLIEDPVAGVLTGSFNLGSGLASVEWQSDGTSWYVV